MHIAKVRDLRIVIPEANPRPNPLKVALYLRGSCKDKKARGMMARWIIENRIEDPERLSEFNEEGYRFDPEGSTADTLLFTRPQPPKKS